MTEFKVGDRIRLTGEHWETGYDEFSRGDIVEVTEINNEGIWAGDAGSVGRNGQLYSESNPEGSGDYSCELVLNDFVETVSAFSSAVSHEDIESITLLGKQLGIEEQSSFEQSVHYHTNKIADLLISKNKAYGDSALNPVRIFSQAGRIEQLNVRIDDKISRIQRGTDYGDEDTVRDLIGYLVLRLIAEESE